jgi:hypothetical protein
MDKKAEYTKVFDTSSPEWRGDVADNFRFLKTQQDYLNSCLKARGHVFLNEIFDALGMPRTSVGATDGWVKNSKLGTNLIDFGLKNTYQVNNSILLVFNVQGTIYDQLDSPEKKKQAKKDKKKDMARVREILDTRRIEGEEITYAALLENILREYDKYLSLIGKIQELTESA